MGERARQGWAECPERNSQRKSQWEATPPPRPLLSEEMVPTSLKGLSSATIAYSLPLSCPLGG